MLQFTDGGLDSCSCGSGIVSTFAAEILGSNAAVYICSDINPHAVRAAMETGKRNRKTLSPVMTNVLDSLRSRCREKIDLLLFNPPYVPTTDEEEKQAQSLASIQGSWAGGAYGTKLIETILPEIPVSAQHPRNPLLIVFITRPC